MKEIVEALISHVIPENKRYIPAWIILSLLSIIGGMLFYPLLNDFKTPFFYIFTLTMFALWAQIFILCSSADEKRLHRQTQIEKMLRWDYTQKAILREFWIQPENIIRIPDDEEVTVKSLIQDNIIFQVDVECDEIIFLRLQLTPSILPILTLKYINFDKLNLTNAQQKKLITDHDVIGELNHIQRQHLNNSRPPSILNASPKVKQAVTQININP